VPHLVENAKVMRENVQERRNFRGATESSSIRATSRLARSI